jgi:hypothetical protein
VPSYTGGYGFGEAVLPEGELREPVVAAIPGGEVGADGRLVEARHPPQPGVDVGEAGLAARKPRAARGEAREERRCAGPEAVDECTVRDGKRLQAAVRVLDFCREIWILSVARPVLQSARIRDYAVVIPAYNERLAIAGIVERALEQAQIVIVVDDGSTDGTAEVLAALPVTLIRNAGNCGKAHSLWRGMQHALSLDVAGVVTLDADGQHGPEDIPRLVELARAHPRDIIVGARVLAREAAPRLRRFANRAADFGIGWAAGQRVADSQSGFRVYPAAVLQSVDIPHHPGRGFVFESEYLILAGGRGVHIRHVPILTLYTNDARASHFRSVRDVTRICLMVAWHLLRQGFHPAGLRRSRSSAGELR